MNRNTLLVVMAMPLMLIGMETYAQKPVVTTAELRAVNVYRRSAELLGRASCTIPAGTSDIVVRNVSNLLMPETLQVGVNSSSVTILGSEFLEDYYSYYAGALDNPEMETMRQKVEQLQLEMRAKKHQRQGYQKALAVLDKNMTLSSQSAITPEGLAKYSDFIQYRYADISERIATLDSAVAKLEKEVDRLKLGMLDGETSQGSMQGRHALRIQVQSEQAQQLTLQLRYIARGAGWEPQYEVKGSDVSSPLRVTLRASLRQRTGVEWSNVQLTLTNGTPTEYQHLPSLSPWFLQVYRPEPMRMRSMGAKQAMAFSNAVGAVAEEVAYDAQLGEEYGDGLMEASVQSNQLNVSYELKMPYSIRANGQESIITLQQQQVPAEFAYHAVPNMMPKAFLVASIEDYAQYGLAGAPATVLFENTYVGRTVLDVGETSSAMEITMGTDPRIAMERKEVSDRMSDRFLSSNREKEVTYDLHVKNNKRESITLHLADRIPLSTNEAIKVELVESSSASYEKETGYLRWHLSLSPGESKTLRVSYRVKYPKNMRITNL